MPDINSSSQTGFMKSRHIHHNIHKTLDIIDFTKRNNIAGVIMTIDMEKCFDRLSHEAIINSFRYFNFGEEYIQWISLFYNKIQVCTQNFGFCSDFFTKTRSTNQGCPFSPSAYLLTGEILANKIRLNDLVKGIKIGEIEYLLSQFADDTDLYLMYDVTVLNAVISTLSDIEANTGLKVSYDKTSLYRIGSARQSGF